MACDTVMLASVAPSSTGAAPDPKATKRALDQLFDSARSGSLTGIDDALAYGIAADVRDVNGFCALHHAGAAGHADVVEALVRRRGCDVDAEDSSGRTALHHAAANARDACVERLITTCEAWVDASDGRDETPLLMACRQGEASTVRILLSRGADATVRNIDGNDAFIEALCVRGDLDIARALVAAGVNPKRSRARCGSKEGNATRSALTVACGFGVVDAVRFLVDECGLHACGADCGEMDYMTPLMTAALMSHVKVIEYLLLSGGAATAHLTSDDGKTAADMFPATHARHDIKRKLADAAAKAAAKVNPRSVVPTPKSEFPKSWTSSGESGKTALDPLEIRMRSWLDAGVDKFEGVPKNVRDMLDSYRQLTKEAELRDFLLGMIEDEVFQEDMAEPDVRQAVDEVVVDFHNVMKYNANARVMRVLNKFRHVQRFCKDRGEKITFDDILVGSEKEAQRHRERVAELKAAAGIVWDDALVALKLFMTGDDIKTVAAANLGTPSTWFRIQNMLTGMVENLAVQGLASILFVVVLSMFWRLGGFERLSDVSRFAT